MLQCEIYIKCDRNSLVQRVDEIASHLALQVCVCVVVCCRVLQCVAGYCSVLQSETYMKYDRDSLEQCAGFCVAGYCRVLQGIAGCRSAMGDWLASCAADVCVVMCCSVLLQSVAQFCSAMKRLSRILLAESHQMVVVLSLAISSSLTT